MIPSAGVAVDSTTTDQVYDLGEIAIVGGKMYQYIRANGAVTGDGYVVTCNQTYDAAMLTTSNDVEGNFVGVVECAFADNDYGWMQVFGACGIRSEQDALANSFLGATSDAGQVDDAAATGLFIENMYFGTATGGADAVNSTGFIRFPRITVRMEPEA